MRGTYAGLSSAPAIEYLKRLGVTTVELMPVHAFVDDRHLVQRGLTNYWGYNTIGYFAPEAHYSASGKVAEFKTMVKTLHSAGLEVILDVVYNHTAEGDHMGPTLSFRGLDNACYYRLTPEDRRLYVDYTGCGNTLNMVHPRVLQMIMDSLRYWVTEMHVDGFRFDLASALARELHEVDRLGAFFDILRQDPVLSEVKLIAEPWDLGEGGYQVGNFPVGWSEWNDKYRDTMRAYWKGDGGLIGEFAQRITGSSDLYGRGGRRPHASINFVTAHDGFTLADLVSYNEKHNEAEPARTTATATTTTCRGTAASRAPPTTPRCARCARASSAICSPRCCSRRACRCCSPATKSAAASAATTTPTARTTRSPGSTGSSTTETQAARVRPAHHRAAPRASGVPPARLLQGASGARTGRQGHRLAAARRRRDDRRRVEPALRALPRRVSRRRGADRDRRARPPGARPELPAAVQRASRSDPVQAAGLRRQPLARAARYRVRGRTGGRRHLRRRQPVRPSGPLARAAAAAERDAPEDAA